MPMSDQQPTHTWATPVGRTQSRTAAMMLAAVPSCTGTTKGLAEPSHGKAVGTVSGEHEATQQHLKLILGPAPHQLGI